MADHRLSESVYQRLLEEIFSGTLAPGDTVSELELARKLRVSRTPVHDAVVQLVKDGLVAQEPNRRPVIADFSGDEIRDIFEMRMLLEGESARRAADRIDRPTLDRLRGLADALDRVRQRARWVEQWAEFDDAFHTAIADACGSPRLAHDIARYRQLHRAINRVHTDFDSLQRAMAEHRDILEALERRDAEAAAEAMIRHIREWQAYFVQKLRARPLARARG